MKRQSDRGIEYLSDQYGGRVIGYEEIEGLTLAQSPEVALVTIALGSGVNCNRSFDEYYDWHVIDGNMFGGAPAYAAKSHAIINAKKLDAKRHALHSHIVLECAKPGSTEGDLSPSGEYYKSILSLLSEAKSKAAIFDKSLFVDCVKLSLLCGQSELTGNSIDFLIAAFLHELRAGICAISGQATFPKFLVSPFNDTKSERCLAEGQLDINHPTLGIVVTSPRYWLPKYHPTLPMLSETSQMKLRSMHSVKYKLDAIGFVHPCSGAIMPRNILCVLNLQRCVILSNTAKAICSS